MILELIGTIEGLVSLAGFLRLCCYLETSGLLDDEQNGFERKELVLLKHILYPPQFVLLTVVL